MDMTLKWRKATYSSGNGGNCVEVAAAAPRTIAVRDSRDPAGPRLAFGTHAWTAFAAQVKDERP